MGHPSVVAATGSDFDVLVDIGTTFHLVGKTVFPVDASRPEAAQHTSERLWFA